MTPEEFRQAGHELIDWIADYRPKLELKTRQGPGRTGRCKTPFRRQCTVAPIADCNLLQGDLEIIHFMESHV